MCGLLLSPAESAKQAINNSNLKWSSLMSSYQRNVSSNSEQPEHLQRYQKMSGDPFKHAIGYM